MDNEKQVRQVQFIAIFNPIPGKGMGRQYKAAPEITDERNYIELGAVVRDQNEEIVSDDVMTIEATDSSQNRTLEGTGDYSKSLNGKFYSFHYEFRTAGDHEITFKCGGASQSIVLHVQE